MPLAGHEGEQTGHGWTLILNEGEETEFDDDPVSMTPPAITREDAEFTDLSDLHKVTAKTIADNGELAVVYNYTDTRYAALKALDDEDEITLEGASSTGLTFASTSAYIKNLELSEATNTGPETINITIKVNDLTITPP